MKKNTIAAICSAALRGRAALLGRTALREQAAHTGRTAALLACALALAAVLAGCSTTVSQEVEKPANLKVENYSSVSSLPFRTTEEMGTASSGKDTAIYTFDDYYRELGERYSSQSEEKEMLAKLDERLSRRLQLADSLSYVDPKTVQYAISQRGAEIPVDMYVSGGLLKFSSRIESEEQDDDDDDDDDKKKDKKESKNSLYWRETSVTIRYQVIEAQTDRVLAQEDFSYSGSSSKVSDWRKVDSTYTVLSSKLDGFITRIMADFTPHTETLSLTLLKSKDKDMKAAEKLAHKGQLVSARKEYQYIYKKDQLFEAGYNAALLYEAMEEYEAALELMQKVWKDSGDTRAKEKIRELEKEVEAAERLRNQKKK